MARTKVRCFFETATGKLRRTVIPEFHEHDEVLVHHMPQDDETMLDVPLERYRALCPRGDYQPDPPALEAHFAQTRG